jgi:hypothetical protein
MDTEKNAPRFLGGAFLFVALVPLVSGLMFTSVVSSGSISDILISISNNPALVQVSVVGQMVTAAGIVVLADLLYIVLSKQHRILALAALGLWLGEAIFVALSQIGALALLPLSQNFVSTGAPQQSYFQTLGEFLYNGVYHEGNTILMWFYCTGGLLWYYLFYRSNYIPRAISLSGLLAVSVAVVGIVLEFLGYSVPIIVYLPILPFELTMGAWLMLKGIRGGSETYSNGSGLGWKVRGAVPR